MKGQNAMKEKYLKLAECYEKLAEGYRAMAESTEENTKDIKSQQTDIEQPVDFESISMAAKKKSADGHREAIKAIITECGVKRLSDIPAEKYSEVMQKLEAL